MKTHVKVTIEVLVCRDIGADGSKTIDGIKADATALALTYIDESIAAQDAKFDRSQHSAGRRIVWTTRDGCAKASTGDVTVTDI